MLQLVLVAVLLLTTRSADAVPKQRTVILDLVVAPEDAPEHVCVITSAKPSCTDCGVAKLGDVTTGADGQRLVKPSAKTHIALEALGVAVDASVTCDDARTCRPFITARAKMGDPGIDAWIACKTRVPSLGNDRVAVFSIEQAMPETIVTMDYSGSQLAMKVDNAGTNNRFTFHLAGGHYQTGRSARTQGTPETANIVLGSRCVERAVRLPLVEDGWASRWVDTQMRIELRLGTQRVTSCRPVRANREVLIQAPRLGPGEVASLTLCKTQFDECPAYTIDNLTIDDEEKDDWLIGAQWSGDDQKAIIPAQWRALMVSVDLGCLLPPLDYVHYFSGDPSYSACPLLQPDHGGRCKATGYGRGPNRCDYACVSDEGETMSFPLDTTVRYDTVEWSHKIRTAFASSELRVPEAQRRLYVQAVDDLAVEKIEIGDSRSRTFTIELDKVRNKLPAFGWISAPWLQCEDAVYVRYLGKFYYKRKLVRLDRRPVVLELDPKNSQDFDDTLVGTPESLFAWAKFVSAGAIEVIDQRERHVPAAVLGLSVNHALWRVSNWRPAARWNVELGLEGHLTFRPYLPVVPSGGEEDVGVLRSVLYARELGWASFGVGGLAPRPGSGWPDRVYLRVGGGTGHSFLNRDAQYVGSADLIWLTELGVAWRVGEHVWFEGRAGGLWDETVNAFATDFRGEPVLVADDDVRFQFSGAFRVNL